MPDDLLITGFTAFGTFAKNPAESVARQVAEESGARFEPLEVSYAAVDAFIDSLLTNPPARWAMVGVAGTAEKLRVETRARNVIGKSADVRGQAPAGTISEAHPPFTDTNFFDDLPALPKCCVHSQDAGDYLCNYVYHQARTRLPGTKAVFFHITPTDKLDEATQVKAILELLR